MLDFLPSDAPGVDDGAKPVFRALLFRKLPASASILPSTGASSIVASYSVAMCFFERA